MPVFTRSPTAPAFAAAWVDGVLAPALAAATGADKKLSAKEAAAAKTATSGPLALAGGALEEIRKLTGLARPGTAKLLAAAHTYAEQSAIDAAGADGKLSLADAQSLAIGKPLSLTAFGVYLEENRVTDGPYSLEKPIEFSVTK